MSPFGTIVLPRRWSLDVRSGTGATHGLAQRGVGRNGRESVMAIDRFCQNIVGPPEWEYEAMGSMVWVQCAASAECIKLSIADFTVTDTLESRSHHGLTFNEFFNLSMKFALWWWRKVHRVELDQMWSWL